MKLISLSCIDSGVSYTLEFDRIDSPGSGFSFECDAKGAVDTSKFNPAALENYEACLAGTNGTKRVGVRDWPWTYRVPSVGECACGAHIELRNFTNPCECGLDYSSSGERLAPREQWGEETGEHWTECL